MDSITVENYRCFREKQSVRLAPLTLLVGENSTGKTSFLALIRALWDVVFRDNVPDFRESPYDLGTFRDIAHYRGGRGGQADSFEASFDLLSLPDTVRLSFGITFEERDGSPFPVKRSVANSETLFEAEEYLGEKLMLRLKTQEDEHEHYFDHSGALIDEVTLIHIVTLLIHFASGFNTDIKNSTIEREQFVKGFDNYLTRTNVLSRDIFASYDSYLGQNRPFAGAPVRSHPHRTYDPIRPSRDPEGEYIPTYLARVSRRNQKEWKTLKDALESFGHSSGLFDEISVKSLGYSDGAPFQIQIRKASDRSRGSRRNLIDVGYGVSQTLPVLTELLRDDAPSMFLLQQPEVHLHPKAQAALGSMFCNIAGKERQIIVETHSDYLIDRVRMDVRDGTTSLKPEDVSILYFESNGLDVKIHSLQLDKDGNVHNQPEGYGQFFIDEMNRSIGL